ncbi:hypothetical protein ACFQVD_08120 [Streptosporangium amethystogenes subsp. fukuiense]|uniref:Uncharacterized protein n=1 Tax=Streptosporangium amethystogenes subsp. fukuiense TaxID=698418 RepID=A0ABW2SUW6_9ACTN
MSAVLVTAGGSTGGVVPVGDVAWCSILCCGRGGAPVSSVPGRATSAWGRF